MNKPYANFQKYRMNHLFKKQFMKIEQNTQFASSNVDVCTLCTVKK